MAPVSSICPAGWFLKVVATAACHPLNGRQDCSKCLSLPFRHSPGPSPGTVFILGQMPGSRIFKSHTGLLLACERVHLSKIPPGRRWCLVWPGLTFLLSVMPIISRGPAGPVHLSVHVLWSVCPDQRPVDASPMAGSQDRVTTFTRGLGGAAMPSFAFVFFLSVNLKSSGVCAVLESCCSLRGDSGPTLALLSSLPCSENPQTRGPGR